MYWLITSVDPFIVYLYNEGITRLATQKFEVPNDSNKDDIQRHLTNFALNNKNKTLITLDGNIPNKMTINDAFKLIVQDKDSLFDKSISDNITVEYLWDQAYRASRDILTAIYPNMHKRYTKTIFKAMGENADTVFPPQFSGLYGIDLILLKNGRYKIFEVNLQPSMTTSSLMDYNVKEAAIREALEITGIRFRPKYFDINTVNMTKYEQFFNNTDYSVEEKRVLLEIID